MELTRIDKPYVFELKNENGNSCVIDASESIGGSGKGFRPMELLGGSLAGCAAIDVISILKKQRIDPDLFKIGINSRRKEGIPSSYASIELVVEIDSDINKEKLSKMIQLVIDKYCSVSRSLDPAIVITHKVI